MSLQHRFAARVREFRVRRGLTQQQLAERLERSVNAVSALERGVSLPTFATLERLCEVLRVPAHEFFAEDATVGDPKQERLLAAVASAARALGPRDLALAAGLLELMAARGAKPAA